jgi:hypothetical protein
MSEVTSNDRRPNWDMWRLMPEATLGELVALSMNIDPAKVRYDRDARQCDGELPPYDEAEEFKTRARIVQRNTQALENVSVSIGRPFQCKYKVPSFVRWILGAKLTVPPELASLLRDDASPQAMTDKAVEEGAPFPHFITSARPEAIPAELMALPDDARITYEHNIGGWQGRGERFAGEYRSKIAATIKRQSEGFYRLVEAAQILADTLPGFAPTDTVQHFLDAHQAGKLPIHRGDNRLLRRVGERILGFYDLLKSSELDEWLFASSGHRFPGAESNAEPLPVGDRGRLLKREALIADNVRRWPSVARDLKDCAVNGLREAARDKQSHGYWWEGSALEWAKARGKVQSITPEMNGMQPRNVSPLGSW